MNTEFSTAEGEERKDQAELKASAPSQVFSGRAQNTLLKLYGDPRKKGWGNKWMVVWAVRKDFPWFPADKIYIHKEFRIQLHKALQALEQRGLHKEIHSFDGCYNLRNVRGSSAALSVHSWGVAIDLNAKENPLGSDGQWSYDFLQTMLDNGIFCGQNWTGRKDPMHFALVNG